MLVAILATEGCALLEDGPPPVAQLQGISGEVTVHGGDEGTPSPGKPGMGLIENDVVSTGSSGQVRVVFQGGNAIALGPDASLVIRKEGGMLAQYGAVLLSGSARASSRGQGVLLALGTPFGFVEVGGEESSVAVNFHDGFTVLLGQVEIVRAGERKTIEAGNSFSVAGLIIPIGGGHGDGADLVLETMTFAVLANPRQVQTKRSGEKRWRSVKKRDMLAGGDALRTRKATGTRVQFGDNANVELGPDTELRITEGGQNDTLERAQYALASGSVVVNMAKGPRRSEQVIAVGEREVSIEPGVRRASVELRVGSKGRGQVTVRQGKATLQDGTVVEAGSTIKFEPGRPMGVPRPLASTSVLLKPRSSSVVYYTSRIPPVSFQWNSGSNQPPYLLELARDREFKKIIVREELNKQEFVYDQMQPGRYYWRVKIGDLWQKGVVKVEKRQPGECANCKRHNIIDDTGEQTVVYFQQTVPAIKLRWKPNPEAVRHRLQVFGDGEFDQALFEHETAEQTYDFPAGRLEEGKYFWLVKGMAAGGDVVSTGRMNNLTIAFDNAITDLSIKTPRVDARVNNKSLVTSGEVVLGARLYLNGRRIPLDSKGRFKERINLSKGSNPLVYKTIANDGVERFYVREVYRR